MPKASAQDVAGVTDRLKAQGEPNASTGSSVNFATNPACTVPTGKEPDVSNAPEEVGKSVSEWVWPAITALPDESSASARP